MHVLPAVAGNNCVPALPRPSVCRLWQLQSKMAAVGGEGTYEARLERVVLARAGIEQRLQVGLAAGSAQSALPTALLVQLAALVDPVRSTSLHRLLPALH